MLVMKLRTDRGTGPRSEPQAAQTTTAAPSRRRMRPVLSWQGLTRSIERSSRTSAPTGKSRCTSDDNKAIVLGEDLLAADRSPGEPAVASGGLSTCEAMTHAA